MSEAIKGQDKLKLAVEKLESELFKDWPKKPTYQDEIGVIINSGYPITFVNCRAN